MKKVLILTVGNNYSKAIKSIEHVKPDTVYFINNDYNMFIDDVIKESALNFKTEVKLIEDIQNIDEIYKKSKEIFKQYSGDYEIHVGVSNGTRAMVTGLSLASIGYDCRFVYVGSTEDGRDKEGSGDVLPGHEKVLSEFHPVKKQAIIEISRGKRYFNKYQFDEALTNFKQAKEILKEDKLIDMYIKITNLYNYWDKFENMIPKGIKDKNAKVKLDSYLIKFIIREINNDKDLKNYFTTYEPNFFNKMKNNFEFLQNKISKKGMIEGNDIYYYLPDLLNNAERRIDEEKYDDATARLYRSSELIAQIRLFELGFVDLNNLRDKKIFHLNKLKLINTNNLKVIEFVARKPDFQDSSEKNIKLPLSDSYTLLSLLNDDLACIKDDISNELSNRNNSILAHGLNHCNEEHTVTLLNKLKFYSKKSFDNFDENLNDSKFPKFENIEL